VSESCRLLRGLLASCQSLHALDPRYTEVRDVSALASCQALHELDLSGTQVIDVSALASCQSLHALDLRYTEVSDVSALASCLSLRKLRGIEEMVGGTNVMLSGLLVTASTFSKSSTGREKVADGGSES
jgi:hypothetical protein